MFCDLFTLYEKEFTLRAFTAMTQNTWLPNQVFTMRVPRKDDALLLFENEGACCRPLGGEPFEVPKGGLVHIARGSRYSWEFSNADRQTTLLFEFTLVDSQDNIIRLGDGVRLIDIDDDGTYVILFNQLIQEFIRPSTSPVFQKKQAYSLLAQVIGRKRKQHVLEQVTDTDLYRGIRYLESDVTQDKSIREIAEMCNMSLSTFERRFKAYSGKTPIEYRLSKRLDRAEAMLKTEEMTVERIAEELNFYDASYLCKTFKQKKGYTLASLKKRNLP